MVCLEELKKFVDLCRCLFFFFGLAQAQLMYIESILLPFLEFVCLLARCLKITTLAETLGIISVILLYSFMFPHSYSIDIDLLQKNQVPNKLTRTLSLWFSSGTPRCPNCLCHFSVAILFYLNV